MDKLARSSLVALATLALAGPAALAQTAAEALVVTTIIATLDSSLTLKLPTGSAFFKDPKAATDLAGRLLGAGAGGYTNYQLYVSRGLATRLADNYVADLATQFAVAGYFQTGQSSMKVGAETWTRTEFTDDASGKTMLLFVSKRPDGVYMLTAKKR